MATSTRDADPGRPPTEVSKPVGDAIPSPVEPGLDQPLPPKERDENPKGELGPILGAPRQPD
ncbi:MULTISPECIES: hypothetical protein [Burkholderiaceae]|uniref:hypothetical protein n=1 Tax=Burkholderiaceae TaxID=119060 RepID=UPI0009EA45FF|nr:MULTISPECIES: hypothetical protein [Burkholderiaceae]